MLETGQTLPLNY